MGQGSSPVSNAFMQQEKENQKRHLTRKRSLQQQQLGFRAPHIRDICICFVHMLDSIFAATDTHSSHSIARSLVRSRFTRASATTKIKPNLLFTISSCIHLTPRGILHAPERFINTPHMCKCIIFSSARARSQNTHVCLVVWLHIKRKHMYPIELAQQQPAISVKMRHKRMNA